MDTQRAGNDSHRAYWSQQMDKAYDFIMQVVDYPVAECGEALVSLKAAIADEKLIVEFSKRKLPGGFDRLFYLRQGLIDNFLSLARQMNEHGWVLKVEDAYRTKEIQTQLATCPAVLDHVLKTILWESDQKTPDEEFVFRRLSALVAHCPKTGTHMSGTAIDISVLNRQDNRELDRGGPYLSFSEITPLESPFVSPQAQKNRRQISAIMLQHGFVAYPWEFWHYSKGDAYDQLLNATGRPASYGPVYWDPQRQSVTPIENPSHRLNSPEQIKLAVARALERLNSGSQ